MLITLSGKHGIGKLARIDDSDYEKIKNRKWYFDSHGYVAHGVYEQGKVTRYLMHRVILGLLHGNKLCVDHINGDPLDNRRENIRIVTQGQNTQNRRKVNKRRKVGFHIRGTTFNARNKLWVASAYHNGKRKYLGLHETQEEAGEIASAWRLKNMTHTIEGVC